MWKLWCLVAADGVNTHQRRAMTPPKALALTVPMVTAVSLRPFNIRMCVFNKKIKDAVVTLYRRGKLRVFQPAEAALSRNLHRSRSPRQPGVFLLALIKIHSEGLISVGRWPLMDTQEHMQSLLHHFSEFNECAAGPRSIWTVTESVTVQILLGLTSHSLNLLIKP